ncbi:MAG: hypothetical protein WDW36_008667 [Sanguina aurantia]
MVASRSKQPHLGQQLPANAVSRLQSRSLLMKRPNSWSEAHTLTSTGITEAQGKEAGAVQLTREQMECLCDQASGVRGGSQASGKACDGEAGSSALPDTVCFQGRPVVVSWHQRCPPQQQQEQQRRQQLTQAALPPAEEERFHSCLSYFQQHHHHQQQQQQQQQPPHLPRLRAFCPSMGCLLFASEPAGQGVGLDVALQEGGPVFLDWVQRASIAKQLVSIVIGSVTSGVSFRSFAPQHIILHPSPSPHPVYRCAVAAQCTPFLPHLHHSRPEGTPHPTPVSAPVHAVGSSPHTARYQHTPLPGHAPPPRHSHPCGDQSSADGHGAASAPAHFLSQQQGAHTAAPKQSQRSDSCDDLQGCADTAELLSALGSTLMHLLTGQPPACGGFMPAAAWLRCCSAQRVAHLLDPRLPLLEDLRVAALIGGVVELTLAIGLT